LDIKLLRVKGQVNNKGGIFEKKEGGQGGQGGGAGDLRQVRRRKAAGAARLLTFEEVEGKDLGFPPGKEVRKDGTGVEGEKQGYLKPKNKISYL